VEGALWRTLRALLLHPGRLTSEYLAGRRRRYVLPLRLYLTASFVFFLLVKVAGVGLVNVTLKDGAEAKAAAQLEASSEEMEAASAAMASIGAMSASAAASAGGGDDVRDHCLLPDAHCTALQVRVARAAQRFVEHPKEASDDLSRRIWSAAPYAVFLMLPVFAAIVMLAYRNRRMRYGEHVVFSLHMHSFWFLSLLPMAFLPAALYVPWGLGVAAYGVWALRRVYGGRLKATLWRASFISLCYLTALLLGTAAGSLYLFVS